MRALATVRRVLEINPIEGADNIVAAMIDGWQVVVLKNQFQVGELVCYFEIDSWVPHTLAPFLSKGKEPREFEGILGERLRTIKLRKCLSQGLVIPLSDTGLPGPFEEGDDLTEAMGILKWERPISPQLRGLARGGFPSEVPKTDENRIQNQTRHYPKWQEAGYTWEVTEKLEGSSMTAYLDLESDFHVCSRNINLREGDTTFWQVARRYDLKNKMLNSGLQGLAIQGELVGPGIQGNIYNLQEPDFYVYKMYMVQERRYLTPPERSAMVWYLGLKHVPVVAMGVNLDLSIADLLLYADGKSCLGFKARREGLVFKHMDSDLSFKAISNEYLLKGGQ